MIVLRSLLTLTASVGLVTSQGCPFGHTAAKRDIEKGSTLENRAALESSANVLSQFTVNDTDVYLTSDAGGPIEDQNSLSAGERGPTLLEDFIFRQKITHFDHERVGVKHDHGN
jgi:catalase